MSAKKLFSYRWEANQVIACCLCGWESNPVHVLYAAKALYGQHVRNDCPIGSRTPGH